MTQPPAATTVWIVDDDLGFVWWLGQVFSEAGCRTLPALSCKQAITLSKKLSVGIDLLVVNPQLPGVIGMIQTIEGERGRFKTISIGQPSPALSAATRLQGNLERPPASEPISRPEWLKKVRRLLKEIAAAAAV